MTDTMLDFDRLTHVHRDDPDASLDAATMQTAGVTERVKAAIVHLLREAPHGLTAFQAQTLYFEQRTKHGWPDVQPYSINRRMSDLHNAHRIVNTGRRGPAASKATATVWELA